MAHTSATSMRAFTKGRAAFDSDEEYRLALRGELDVREDFGYEANEDPDDGEGGGKDAGDLEDLTDEEAVRAELEDLEERIDGTKFLETLERFMKDCSGRDEPPYPPFPPVRDKEVLAVFRDGSGGLRLSYGAYGLEADRLEGDEVVKTWKGLDETDLLNDWDDALAEMAGWDEGDDWNEDDRKRQFVEDLPMVLGDRKRGAEFLDFVLGATEGRLDKGINAFQVDGPTDPADEGTRTWFGWSCDQGEFYLRRTDKHDRLATWDKEEFLEKLREVAWDDADARESMLGGGDVEDAWEALDGAWYDEEDDGSVEETVGKFLDRVKSCRGNGSVREDVDVVGGSGYGEAGRVDMTLVWSGVAPDLAQLTIRTWLATEDKDEDTYDVPLAFLKWWAFGQARGW